MCSQVSCGRAIRAPRRAHFGKGNGPIWMDNVRCRGQEVALEECPFNDWGNHDCEHEEDASVICNGRQIG